MTFFQLFKAAVSLDASDEWISPQSVKNASLINHVSSLYCCLDDKVLSLEM